MCSLVPLILARWLIGFGCGAGRLAQYLIIFECAPSETRGLFVSFEYIFTSMSNVLGYLMATPSMLGTEQLWPLAMSITCIFAPFCIVALCFMPDSPRFLYFKGAVVNAKHSIGFYQGEARIQQTMALLETEQEATNSLRMSLSNFWKAPQNRFALSVGVLLNASQVLSGATIFLTYSTTIIESIGLDHATSSSFTVVIGLCRLCSAIFSAPCPDKFGRKPLLVWGHTFCCLANIILILIFLLLSPSVFKAILVSFFISLNVASMTFAQSGFVIQAEFYSQKARPMGIMYSRIFGWGLGFLMSSVYLPFIELFGVVPSLIPFVFFTAFGVVFIRKKVPETAGRTFVQIQEDLLRIKLSTSTYDEDD